MSAAPDDSVSAYSIIFCGTWWKGSWVGEKNLIYCFVFFCSLFCIFGFSFLRSPSSLTLVCKEGACVIWGLSSVTACWWCPVPVLGPGTDCSCLYQFSGHNPLQTILPNEFRLTKKELTTECVRDNTLGTLAPEKWTFSRKTTGPGILRGVKEKVHYSYGI